MLPTSPLPQRLAARAIVAWARSIAADRVDLSATPAGQRIYEKLGFTLTSAPHEARPLAVARARRADSCARLESLTEGWDDRELARLDEVHTQLL